MKKTFLCIIIFIVHSVTMNAQINLASLNDTSFVKKEKAPVTAPQKTDKKWNQFQNKFFTLNIGVAALLDYNILSQDDNNIQQVGKVDPEVEFRAERIILSGSLLFFKYPWRYMISANYNGLDAAQGTKTFGFIDYNFEIPFGKTGGWLTVGKQKEGVGLEYISPGTQGMFTERGSGAPMFVRQRNLGIRYSNSVLDQRLAYTLGFFNNWLESGKSFSDNGSQFVTRISGLPHYTSDRDLMHLGAAIRYTKSSGGKLGYKAKPEVNTAPSFINTESFDASNANTLMLEWIGVRGPVMIIGEYMNTFVSSSSKDNPSFNYYQIGGSWFITGENRKYNRMNGNPGKLIPKKNFNFTKNSGPGAIEVGLRYTHSDLTDKSISGGKFGRITGALSWFPSVHFRFEVNYGHGKLDRDKLNGSADFWQFRAQYEL